MRLAIVGSRGFDDYTLMKQTLAQLTKDRPVTCVISGGAAGADSLGEFWAKENGIPTMIFKPDWRLLGRAAGHIRNTDIIDNSDVILVFHDGASPGTADSIAKAKKVGKELIVVKYIPRQPG